MRKRSIPPAKYGAYRLMSRVGQKPEVDRSTRVAATGHSAAKASTRRRVMPMATNTVMSR